VARGVVDSRFRSDVGSKLPSRLLLISAFSTARKSRSISRTKLSCSDGAPGEARSFGIAPAAAIACWKSLSLRKASETVPAASFPNVFRRLYSANMDSSGTLEDGELWKEESRAWPGNFFSFRRPPECMTGSEGRMIELGSIRGVSTLKLDDEPCRPSAVAGLL